MKQNEGKLNQQSVLLFTGGAKGITAQCAIALAEVLPCTYVLMGRSQPMQDPVWAVGITDAAELKAGIAEQLKVKGEKPLPAVIESQYRRIVSSREITETLTEFQRCGAEAHYLFADVTDAAQVTSAIAGFEREQDRKISGLIHGAGRLADKRIERKTSADFEAVYGTKAIGVQNVMNALDAEHLELLVLFSSVAGTFGNVGQADYAMANEVLNKTAYAFHKAHPGCQVISINWGPWDSGMVNDALKNAFSERGIELISMEEGTRQFVDVVLAGRQPVPQIVIGSAIQRKPEPNLEAVGHTIRVGRVIEPARNPFLLDHQIGKNRVLPATCAAAWMADTCQNLFPGYRFFRLEDYRVMKGVVFADDTPQKFVVEVNTEADTITDELSCQVRVFSEGERPALHYQAVIILRNASADWERPRIPTTENNHLETMPADAYYHKKILFHGPAFHGLKTMIKMDAESLTTISHLAAVDVGTQGQFPVWATNPYMNDVILQGLLVWTYAMDQAVCLPSGIHKLEQYAHLPFDRDCYVQAYVTHHTASSIRADAVVTDAEGRVYLRVEGVEGTISKALLPLFQSSRTSTDLNNVENLNPERITAQG